MITNIVNTVIIWCLISYCFSCKVVESEVAVYEKDILYNKLTQNSPPYYTCIIFEEAHERGDWQTILNCSDYKLILANRLSTDSVGFKILLFAFVWYQFAGVFFITRIIFMIVFLYSYPMRLNMTC